MTETIRLGGDGGNAFAFDHIGASVTGKIRGGEEVQQTDIVTGQPKEFPGGGAMMMMKVTLATNLRDDEHDDGLRSVFLRGSAKPETKSTMAAVREAARAATGSTDIAVGGTLTLTYVGDGRTPQGFTMKQYEARYVPPAMSLGGEAASAPQQPYAGATPTNSAPVAPAQAPAATPPQNGSSAVPTLIGWLNGKPVDDALLAAFENSGVDVRTVPGFVAAP